MKACLGFHLVSVSFITIISGPRAGASSIFQSSLNNDMFNSDVDLPFLSDTLSLDQPTLSFNDQIEASLPDVATADMPMNFDVASPIGEDPSPSLFQTPYDSNNDDFFLSESISPSTTDFEVANIDCSTRSEWMLPTIGKSRVRRNEALKCSDPAFPPRDKVLQTLQNSDALRLFSGRRSSEDENTACWVATHGILPWGVCSSGRPKDVTPVNLDLMEGGEVWKIFTVVRMQSVTIGMFLDQGPFL